jgi:hypothetical protein
MTRLFAAGTTNGVRQVVADGFTGIPELTYPGNAGTIEEMRASEATVVYFVKFRDLPPAGMTFSRTTEMDAEQTSENEIRVDIDGGPVLMDDMGDFQVPIDVPAEVIAEYEVVEDPPSGWPFREYWLPPDVANEYRPTLLVLVPEDPDQEVPLELFTREHAVVITERFAAFGSDENPAPVGARCVCGDDWRWSGGDTDPRDQFPGWLAAHS